MPRQQRSIQTSREGRISLAIASYHNNPKQSIRALAKAFDIPQSTLHTRIHGVQPRSETVSVNRKLSPIEEQSLVQWILDLDRRGFPPHIIDVRRMADALLAARGQDPPPQPIGKKWFKLVEETRQTYGVLYQDIYNFDETRFAIGVAGTSKVVTSSERVGRAVVVQPGNREWVTAIECVNASSWCLPPLVILSGKVHQSSWYNRLPLDWVKHFNHYTAARTARVYRLLVLDGHSSHATPEFDQYCAKNKIINLCMPPHTSHLLQPLDVSCFSPLKRAYGCEIEKLACQGVYHIDKIDFLTVYQQIRPIVFTQQNIQAGFQATGLVPPCPDRVLSSLTVARTPSPPQTTIDNNAAACAAAQTETPHTVAELQQQVRYLQERLRRKSESPTSVAIRQLAKSAQLAMQSAVILAEENKKLRAENQRQRQKQEQQRQYIASSGVLQAQQAQQIATEAERVVMGGDQNQTGERRQRAPPTCTKCHVQEHTRNSCRAR
ncbi:Transposase [Pyrenophora tritici-repentis]|uniref:Transposase n=1 Tax=Pyrenophora tritici-repentis TaxID=45151 RepID=A0A922N3S6_9PLEO|nr:Transposase [Pyrenophora tritici-repentis]KAI1668767.1 Transposase [Pyrenophora tritici-repentis]KAI1680405.1 Transposase [Pyrenophora tritici-repentis]